MQIIRRPDAQQILCRKNHHGNKLNDSQYFLYSPSLSKVWRKMTEIFNRMTKTIKTSKHRLGISVLFPICIISNALFFTITPLSLCFFPETIFFVVFMESDPFRSIPHCISPPKRQTFAARLRFFLSKSVLHIACSIKQCKSFTIQIIA